MTDRKPNKKAARIVVSAAGVRIKAERQKFHDGTITTAGDQVRIKSAALADAINKEREGKQ